MSVLKTYTTDTGYFPSLTWKIKGGHIEGLIDGLDAVRQAVELIIDTERYQWPIYSSDYGVELADLIGKRRAYIQSDIERRITDALLEDDRVTEVSDFVITYEREHADINLNVKTKFGDITVERSVPLG